MGKLGHFMKNNAPKNPESKIHPVHPAREIDKLYRRGPLNVFFER